MIASHHLWSTYFPGRRTFGWGRWLPLRVRNWKFFDHLQQLWHATGIGLIMSGFLTRYLAPLLGDRLSVFIGIFIAACGVFMVPFITAWWDPPSVRNFCLTHVRWQLYPLIILRATAHVSSECVSFYLVVDLRILILFVGPSIQAMLCEEFAKHELVSCRWIVIICWRMSTDVIRRD